MRGPRLGRKAAGYASARLVTCTPFTLSALCAVVMCASPPARAGEADEAEVAERVRALVESLKDTDVPVHISVAEALGSVGAAAVPALVLALKDTDPNVRGNAAYVLARIGPAAKAAVPGLIEALRDTDPDVRRNALHALRRMGPAAKAGVPALILALKDADRNVRTSAAHALGGMGPAAKESVPALVLALKDTNRNVRTSAARALGGIGPAAAAAVPALRRPALRDDQGARNALSRIDPVAGAKVSAALEPRTWGIEAGAGHSFDDGRTSARWGLARNGDGGVFAAEVEVSEDGSVPRYRIVGIVLFPVAFCAGARRNLGIEEESVFSIDLLPTWYSPLYLPVVVGYKQVEYAKAETFRGLRLTFPVEAPLLGRGRFGPALVAAGEADICVGASDGFAFQSNVEGYVQLRYAKPGEERTWSASVWVGVEAAWDSGNDTFASDAYVRASFVLAF